MNNTTQNCPDSLQYSPMFIALASVSALSGAICLVGNTVVIWTIYKTKRLHCVSYFLITSLALADDVVGIVLNPMLSARVVLYSYLRYSIDIPKNLKIAEDFLWIQGLLVSTFNLAAISIDRFTAIRKSLHYKAIMTTQRCRIIIILTWIAPTFIACFRIFLTADDHKWLWLATVVLAVFFPLSTTTFSHLKIFKSAQKQARRHDPENIKNTKAAKTMAIILGVFSVTYFPCIVIACIHAFKEMDTCDLLRLRTTAWPWASCIAYASSAVNPWIYSMRISTFRHACKKAFGRDSKRNVYKF